MKATSKSPKVPVIEAVLVAVAVAMVGFVIWYVQDSTKKAEQALQQADTSTQTEVAPSTNDVSVLSGTLPAGWQIDSLNQAVAALRNTTTECTAEALISSETSSGAAYQQEIVSAIEDKGYIVRKLNTGTQSVNSNGKAMTMPSTSYRISLDGQTRYQSYGSLATPEARVSTTVTCPKQTDLTAAGSALQSITINRPLTF